MPRSTIVTVKGNLKTQLAARAGLSSAQVSWGTPAGEPSPDLVILGDVSQSEITRTTNQSRREEYDLQVVISSVAAGTDQQTLTVHARALLAELEDQLDADPTIGGPLQWAVITGIDLAEPNTQTQMESRFTVRVHCVALI